MVILNILCLILVEFFFSISQKTKKLIFSLIEKLIILKR